MAPPKGNQHWKKRTKHGRDKLFTSPEILFDAACEYFQYCEDNPIVEEKVFHAGGIITRADVELLRPFTIAGLNTFLDISKTTLLLYKKDEKYTSTIERIESIIYDQKFTGATVGLFNSNIIARDLGLTDKQEVKQVSELSDEELDEKIKELNKGVQ
ncbi:MAG TPA: DNA-packaging protein [Flavobacteriales bacterium]|nr:DNA-packaging protein [Methylococcaceae bacterium]HHZ96384.1 DNA-packaging protein [Flavobacteriales bacterium]